MLLNTTKLKDLRREQNFTQEALSLASGLSLRTIQRIERTGSASVSSVSAICNALNVSTKKLDTDGDHITMVFQKEVIMRGLFTLGLIAVIFFVLFHLAGQIAFYFDVVTLIFILAFPCLITVLTFGVSGLFRSIYNLKSLFSSEIRGGEPARFLAKIYRCQITYCYAGAVFGFVIGLVALLNNQSSLKGNGMATNFLTLFYALILCELVLRPVAHKLELCDTPG